ncbi:hypothetical protein F2Q68_00044298 [Brassica cretica]|uniref:RNase H type-1 domain-containing protein n=1 Tax=Brassica cretica TaxID=69181 RepID=A0A8S9LJ64_BRACR|nr:hypothetical protein F2Q68_00044298 [Brassica cretica]
MLIWQLLTGHVALTRNLTRRNMRCDNYCPRREELEETVTHAIFECSPALQVWGIDRDPLELVRHAESECQAWFDADEVVQPMVQDNNPKEPQVISLGNICLLDGSWASSAHFSGCRWVWMDSAGNIQLMGTRNFTRRESALHSEVEALRWAMENMLQHSTCQSFGTDCKELIVMIKDPQAWPSFATELERIETLQICFPDFKIIHVPRAHNQTSDFFS